MKKTLSIITALALCLAMLPLGIFSASAEGEAWDFVTVRAYDGDKAPHITDTSIIAFGKIEDLPDREFTHDYAPSENEWSFKLTAPAGITRNIWFINWINDTYSAQASGMRFWVANPSNAKVSFRMNYNALYSGVDKTYAIPAKRTYYLQSASGTTVHNYVTSAYNDTHGYIDLPAGFKGWLYVPFGTRAYEYNRIRMFFDGKETDTTVYISRMEYYHNALAEAKQLDRTFDTAVTLDTTYFNDRTTNTTATLTTEYRDGDYGQALKVTDASGFLRFVSLCAKLASDTASGIKFWVKNPQDSSAEITVMAGDKDIAGGAAYYLQPEGKAPYIVKTVSSTAESGRKSIIIPASFTGYVYLPYTAKTSTCDLKTGNLQLILKASSALGKTLYFDSFCNYDFSSFDTVDLANFDEISNLSTYMWSHESVNEISTDVADGAGQSVKATLSTDAITMNRFRYFVPSTTDAAALNGCLGYKVWVKNPNSFALNAYPQFTSNSRPATPNKVYYLCTENSVTGHKFKTLYPTDKNVGCLTLPAGFEGYVFVPKTSVNFGTNNSFDFSLDATVQFRFNFLASPQGGTAYIDSFGLYNSVEELVDCDLNGDGVVNLLDLIRMKKYAADSNVFINELCLDIDNNGEVELAVDLAALKTELVSVL